MKPTIQRSTYEQLYCLNLRNAIHDPKHTFLVFLPGLRRLSLHEEITRWGIISQQSWLKTYENYPRPFLWLPAFGWSFGRQEKRLMVKGAV